MKLDILGRALVAALALLLLPVAAKAQANPFFMFGPALQSVMDGTVDLDNDSFRMTLHNSYTPNQATHGTWADVSATEISGTGYTAAGNALTCTVSRSGLAVTFDCDDQSWPSSTLTAQYACIVRDADGNGALASTDILMFCSELQDGSTISTTNGTLGVTINASGVYTVTAAGAA